ncbi:MAG: hypothetical protein F4X02_15825 [Chloroflexi bacterium]|nr:hypothetical protein [Chloroflexota bacterium]
MQVVQTPEFEAQVKRLRKIYRQIDKDLALLSGLESGVRPQDMRLQNMGGMEIYKARLPNTSARVGTRGGFRVVYRVKDGIVILLLLIWAKSRTVDMPDSQIRRVASQY